MIVACSLIKDLFVLNIMMMKGEKKLEYKYPQIDYLAGLDHY